MESNQMDAYATEKEEQSMEINEKVFSKVSENRAKELCLEVDPFTVPTVYDDGALENHYTKMVYYAYFKLYDGLQEDLDDLCDELRVYERAGFFDDLTNFKNHIHYHQIEILATLFSIIIIPASFEIKKLLADSKLTNEEKHAKLFYYLPSRVRRALPTPLKWGASPFEWPTGTYGGFNEDIEQFEIEEWLEYY